MGMLMVPVMAILMALVRALVMPMAMVPSRCECDEARAGVS